ncbi:MAG: parallel beta-helix domain-containing protein [Cyclobacteriaceae bacterium]
MRSLISIASLLLFLSCGPKIKPLSEYLDIEKDMQTQFILAEDGMTIEIPAGHYRFSRSLVLEGRSQVVIKGAGRDQTFLSFRDQEEGAEGIKIANCRNIILEDFTIEDASGDNIKVNDTHGITFNNVKSAWTGKPKETNGAYAFYPVSCSNVLIDNCIATGASDAGIYVGQSRNVVVRNSKAYKNVAGIEIENTIMADVYDNESYNNTGGILVFDLPGLTQYGRHVRVYNNKVTRNNHKNFAPPGNIVGSVPPGTGVMVLATREVEVFENEVTNNRTVGMSVVSYVLVDAANGDRQDADIEDGSLRNVTNAFEMDSLYNPYPADIYIHNNSFSNNTWFPTLKNDFGLLFLREFGLNIPDIIYDGITESNGQPDRICLSDNGEATFANLDAANDFANISREISTYQCEGTRLQPVQLAPLAKSGAAL